MTVLNETELRVLGALVEKQISTPDYYPLSLNALVNACNQKNHRDPVVAYGETEVRRAIETLRDKALAFVLEAADSRVPKYGHNFPKTLELAPDEAAVLCVLMLRGPQTPGELRSRTPHLHEFESLPALEETLQRLAARAEPLVRKLPRLPGMKEARYAHLLAGEIKIEEPSNHALPAALAANLSDEPDRIAKLEAEITALWQQIDQLKKQFENFGKRLG